MRAPDEEVLAPVSVEVAGQEGGVPGRLLGLLSDQDGGRLRQRPRPPALAGLVFPVAVLVDEVATELFCVGGDGRVLVVAVSAFHHELVFAGHDGLVAEAVAILVDVAFDRDAFVDELVAVLVLTVAGLLCRGVDRGVGVVAVHVGRGAVSVGIDDRRARVLHRRIRVADLAGERGVGGRLALAGPQRPPHAQFSSTAARMPPSPSSKSQPVAPSSTVKNITSSMVLPSLKITVETSSTHCSGNSVSVGLSS